MLQGRARGSKGRPEPALGQFPFQLKLTQYPRAGPPFSAKNRLKKSSFDLAYIFQERNPLVLHHPLYFVRGALLNSAVPGLTLLLGAIPF